MNIFWGEVKNSRNQEFKKRLLRRDASVRYADTPNADTPIRRYADTPIHRYTDTPIRRYADTPIRRYADTPIRRYADTPIRRYADTPPNAERRYAPER
jgi:hypothetical protein